ncbi:hypothetical protein GCM10011571_06860 [Marinithermofilum abyssi]|uniref:Uncharacterized protein n=1 Tax=Marinithermofilum abyssi TaxID=1571185 RepID=A0A8J2VBM7_9BACL|nr:hypothetical protein [Marinithermofilum abyssi]GGE08246.1 hypothetical protein GCM10011571_06860 [Marinithermofilum abyssi]
MKDEQKNPKPSRRQPTVAPGITDEAIEKDATKEEIRKGKSTSVTRLGWETPDNT